MSAITELQIDGRLATPQDEDWDQARLAWNLAADLNPAAVAFVESADDVAAVVRHAAENSLHVVAQGTGHGATPLPALDNAILIKTERLRDVSVDGAVARVEAGVLSVELAQAAEGAGRFSMPGSSPDVGVVGYTLGGGLSWLSRRYGFACNSVRAFEVVTADGETGRVDAKHEPDLFWAMRGGGGSFAIVTAMEVELLPFAEVYAGAVLYPAEVGTAAMRAYRDWAAGAGNEVTSIIRFLRPPPVPGVPEPLRNKPLLTIDAAVVGDPEAGPEAVAALRQLGEPIMDTFAPMPASGLCKIHMDPEQPVPGIGDHSLITELDDALIDRLYELLGPESGSPLLMAELRQLGGAIARQADDCGALSHLGCDWAMYAVGMPMTPELGDAIGAYHAKLKAELADWHPDGSYLNFTEAVASTEEIFDADTATRLAEVKRKWDPDGRLLANHAPAS
jgi:FAD/FMN-containing dehydrogenase